MPAAIRSSSKASPKRNRRSSRPLREAAADGVRILESEIVGLVPADALPPNPERRLKLRAQDVDRVLEHRLEQSKEERKTKKE